MQSHMLKQKLVQYNKSAILCWNIETIKNEIDVILSEVLVNSIDSDVIVKLSKKIPTLDMRSSLVAIMIMKCGKQK